MNVEDLHLHMYILVPRDINLVMLDFHDIIRNTLAQLDRLKKFTVDLQVACGSTSKKSLYSEWNNESIVIIDAMKNFAQCGCEFVCLHDWKNGPSRKLVKTMDGRVVQCV